VILNQVTYSKGSYGDTAAKGGMSDMGRIFLRLVLYGPHRDPVDRVLLSSLGW
jgi:hypothetical protein